MDRRSDICENSEQITVRVGKACNFKCVFCNVSDNEGRLAEVQGFEAIAADVERQVARVGPGRHVNFDVSGGEPSAFQKQTLFAFRYGRSALGRRGLLERASFRVQTNASNVTPEFAARLAAEGVSSALVSSHTVLPEEYEPLIGVPFHPNFARVQAGIRNLIGAGIPVVTNTVLSAMNRRGYLPAIRQILREHPEVATVSIGFVQPHGDAAKNAAKLDVSYARDAALYARSIFEIRAAGRKASSHIVGPPPCHLPSPKFCLESLRNLKFRQDFFLGDSGGRAGMDAVNDADKVRPAGCASCLYFHSCSGVWKGYAGAQAIRPVPLAVFPPDGSVPPSRDCAAPADVAGLRRAFSSGAPQAGVRVAGPASARDLARAALAAGFLEVSLLAGPGGAADLARLAEESGATNLQLSARDAVAAGLDAALRRAAGKDPLLVPTVDLLADGRDPAEVAAAAAFVRAHPGGSVRAHVFFPPGTDARQAAVARAAAAGVPVRFASCGPFASANLPHGK